MTLHAVEHALGWACLLAILAIAIWSMVEVVAPKWRTILSLAAGNFAPAHREAETPLSLEPAE